VGEKPLILVFDDQWATRQTILRELIGDRAEIRDISHFTQESLQRGEAAVMVSPELVAKAKPTALIMDLSVVPSLEGDWSKGVKVLRLLRQFKPLEKIPVLVVSDYANHQQAQFQLKSLGVPDGKMFFWPDLSKSGSSEQQKFRKTISEVLHLEEATTG